MMKSGQIILIICFIIDVVATSSESSNFLNDADPNNFKCSNNSFATSALFAKCQNFNKNCKSAYERISALSSKVLAIEQQQKLRQVLDQDRLLDEFLFRLDSMSKVDPVLSLTAMYTLLLEQDSYEFSRWYKNADEFLVGWEIWIEEKGKTMGKLKKTKWDNEDGKSEDDITLSEAISELVDLISDVVKVFWNLRSTSFFRLMKLTEHVSQDDVQVAKQLRLYSALDSILTVFSDEKKLSKYLPEVANWILEQDQKRVGKWVRNGNKVLKTCFEGMNENNEKTC